jgi:phosphoribosylformylglycinamidine synthase PurS subunit
MKATIRITLKNGVLDPQGKAVETALGQLGFGGLRDLRQGKLIEVHLDETDADKARAQLSDMCEKLLANTVIENYDIDISAEQ